MLLQAFFYKKINDLLFLKKVNYLLFKLYERIAIGSLALKILEKNVNLTLF